MTEKTTPLSGGGRQLIHSDYYSLMIKRAKGSLPDMGCAVNLSELIKNRLLPNFENSKSLRIIDIGCAAGHYFRTLTKFGVPIDFYTGIEVDPKMVQAASRIWSNHIQSGRMKFILDDVESQTQLESCDLIICYNSFMYYRSARCVLTKLLKAAKSLIIRSYFADSNYRILRGQSRDNNDRVKTPELEVFNADGDLVSGDYWTIYGFGYFEQLLKDIDRRLKIVWLKEQSVMTSIKMEESLGVKKRYGTQVLDGYEISYPILQPWGVVLVTKE